MVPDLTPRVLYLLGKLMGRKAQCQSDSRQKGRSRREGLGYERLTRKNETPGIGGVEHPEGLSEAPAAPCMGSSALGSWGRDR